MFFFALAFYSLTCKRNVFAVHRDLFICSQDTALNSGLFMNSVLDENYQWKLMLSDQNV